VSKNKAPPLPFNRETILKKHQKIQKKNKTKKTHKNSKNSCKLTAKRKQKIETTSIPQ
jgi:hypothetical protein